MSNLVEHAKRELSRIGEEEEIVEGYLKMIQIFADMGHSGGSASVFIPTLYRLLNFENLTELTNDPEEWQRHPSEMWDGKGDIWQNIRNSKAFSEDGGKTYFFLPKGDHVNVSAEAS